MNLYHPVATVRHLLISQSTAGHGVHSPFIYDFLTTVIRNKTDDHIVRHVERLRSEMLADDRIISITDLGAGSLRMKGAERKSEGYSQGGSTARETGCFTCQDGTRFMGQGTG